MQTDFESNLASGMQSLRRRARLILQLKVGMKRREMQWHFGPQMLEHPFGKLSRFRASVIQRWNDQIGYLKPHIRLVLQPLKSFEDWLQMGERDAPVEILCEGFQVHIRRVHMIVYVVERF